MTLNVDIISWELRSSQLVEGLMSTCDTSLGLQMSTLPVTGGAPVLRLNMEMAPSELVASDI